MSDLGLLLNPQIFPVYDPLGKPHTPPDVGIFDSPAVNVCINSEWAGHISGMVARLIVEGAWVGDEDAQLAAVNQILKFMDALGNPDNIGDCETVNNCCDENMIRYRMNGDGTFEQSTDGGETWEDLPEFGSPLDPQTSFPPITGEDAATIRCKAANSVTWFFHNIQKQYHQSLVDEVTGYGLALILEGALVLIGLAPFSLIAAAGTIIAALVATKEAADFEAEFTPEFWQKLCDRAYCDVDATGVYINTDPRQIINEVLEDFPGFAGQWLDKTMGIFSGAALTNTAAAGFTEGLECGDCDDTCNSEQWILFPDFVTAGQTISYPDASHAQVTAWPAAGKYYAIIYTGSDSVCCKMVGVTQDGTEGFQNFGWTTCNNPVDEYVPLFTGLGPSEETNCLNHIYMVSNVPFTAIIEFAAC